MGSQLTKFITLVSILFVVLNFLMALLWLLGCFTLDPMAEKFRVTSNSAEFIAAELATKTVRHRRLLIILLQPALTPNPYCRKQQMIPFCSATFQRFLLDMIFGCKISLILSHTMVCPSYIINILFYHVFFSILAVKCNTDPILLKCLAKLGTGFDCASKSEIGSILDMGVSPERIVFANPCKPQSHIRLETRVEHRTIVNAHCVLCY